MSGETGDTRGLDSGVASSRGPGLQPVNSAPLTSTAPTHTAERQQRLSYCGRVMTEEW